MGRDGLTVGGTDGALTLPEELTAAAAGGGEKAKRGFAEEEGGTEGAGTEVECGAGAGAIDLVRDGEVGFEGAAF